MHSLLQHLHGLDGCNVDLVDLRQARTVLRMQVVMLGRRIYCLDQFDVTVMCRYHKLSLRRNERP